MFGRETPVELGFHQVEILGDGTCPGGYIMAKKKIIGMAKLQIPAGKATAPPVVRPWASAVNMWHSAKNLTREIKAIPG